VQWNEGKKLGLKLYAENSKEITMTTIRLLLNTLAVFVVCLACSSLAQAQATRTWVSGVGDDANPCSRTAPCKTFAGAISKTAACGEISVLDPGGFGGVTITKAITINGDGTLAGILAANVNGVIVNAGVNDVVILRSISINGACTSLNGIRYLAGKHLHVENCSIYGFTGVSSFGIEGANVGAGEMTIENTSITNCTIGIRVSANASNTASINNCEIQRGSFGVDVLGGRATISNSVVSHQSNSGVVSEGTSVVNVVSTVVANNATGVNVFVNGSTTNLANNDIFGNSTGVLVTAGAVCNRFQNNRVFSNTVAQINGVCNPQNNQ
jgi:parallel beta helix pectate lyase-like protein